MYPKHQAEEEQMFLLQWLKEHWPVKLGNNLEYIEQIAYIWNGSNQLVPFTDNTWPWTNAAYVACGWVHNYIN